tara:strand:- start:820 stop:1173 length:354 start_codon:yes stop_codon:yes gene_type:complete
MTRYVGRTIFINDDDGYQETLLDKRDLEQITQYSTARFYYPSVQEIQKMNVSTRVWSATSKMYNLAHEIYGDPRLWWLIGWFNQKPTEAHWNVGDIIYIPNDTSQILAFFKRQNGSF